MINNGKMHLNPNVAPNENKSYKSVWSKIKHNNASYFEMNEKNEKDYYFKYVPFSQKILAEKDQICNKIIDYSSFFQHSAINLDKTNAYECFHGILSYIYYYSNNKFNIEELEFHFSGSNNHTELSIKNNPNESNILNIFDYKNINKQFTVKNTRNAFFGVTFKHIKVTPIAYSIRSGQSNNYMLTHITSFTFEGFNDETNEWDVLDERDNINDLIPDGSFYLFYVKSTKKSYSSFKIKQTEKGSNGYWGFTISAFDIHGIVSLRKSFLSPLKDIKTSISNEKDIFNKSFLLNTSNDFNYNPMMDISKYII